MEVLVAEFGCLNNSLNKYKMRPQFNIRFLAFGVLALLIAAGIALRLTGLNWDANFHLHPDERFLCIIAPQLTWPHSWAEYFDSSLAPLNPFNYKTDFFVYGQLPLVVTKAIAAVSGRDTYDEILVIGRALSSLCDMGTMLFVFLIGKKVRSTLTGFLAASLLGLTALNIQQSHFWTVDNFAVFFCLAAFYFALCTSGRKRDAMLAGVLLGAAAACKISAILFAPVIAIIALQKIIVVEAAAETASSTENRWHFVKLGLVTFFCAFAAFRVFHPVAFVGQGGVLTLWGLLDVRFNPQFWSALSYQSQITSGQIDVPFNLQWFGRTNYLWPLQNLAGWGIGWPILISFLAAIVLAISQVLRRRKIPISISISVLWCVFAVIFYGAQFSKFTRYYLVITPFIALLVAWFWGEIFFASKHKITKIAITSIPAGVLLSSLIWSLMVTSIYTREHPRVAASRWIETHIARGTIVANETAWDESLPLKNAQLWPSRDLDLFALDDEKKRRDLLKKLDESQWIFVSSSRAWKTIPRLPARFPLTSEYYRALFDGRLGFVLQQEFTSFPQLEIGGWKWEINDEKFEEALTVYDHPRVLLFRKTDKYSRGNSAAILSKKALAAAP